MSTAEEERRAQYEAYAASVALCLRARKQQMEPTAQQPQHHYHHQQQQQQRQHHRTPAQTKEEKEQTDMYFQVVRLLQQRDDKQLRVLYR